MHHPGDVHMCFMANQTQLGVIREFVNDYPKGKHIYFGIKACPEDTVEIAAEFGDKFFVLNFGPMIFEGRSTE